jgi:hypothetical protein
MFFGSPTRSFPEPSRSKGAFARDLAASLVTLGALGVLLVTIQAKPVTTDSRTLKAVSGLHKADPSQKQAAQPAARQPSDMASTPDADEEQIAKAMVAFALTKVSPLRPEPMTSIPESSAPLSLAANAPRKPQKAASATTRHAARIPAGAGQVGFTQAEWPVQPAANKFSATPKDQPTLVAMTRFVPKPDAIINGAQSLAGGARKTVGYGLSGLRSGVNAVQETAFAVAGKLW